MSLVAMLKRNGPSGYGYGSTAEEVTTGLSLEGKTILITGVTSGLGQEAARVLAKRGARVLGTARSVDKANAALAVFAGKTTGLACELADPSSVRACVEAVKQDGARLDAIICNAGIMALPKLQQAHGVELQLFTNHIGHFLLVTGLLDRLADDGRVVMLSSAAHKAAPRAGIELDNLSGARGYSGWKAYGQSKLANILFAKELARRFAAGSSMGGSSGGAKDGPRRTANAVHPGVIATNLSRHMSPLVELGYAIARPIALKDVGQGAATEVYVAVHPGAAHISGAYFEDCNVATPRADADDAELAKKLWAASEEIAARV